MFEVRPVRPHPVPAGEKLDVQVVRLDDIADEILPNLKFIKSKATN